MRLPTIEELEKAIDFPASAWPGHCTLITRLTLASGLVEGREVYGHYRGPIADGSLFDRPYIRALGWASHGWIELPDGRIYDPTRWAFEGRLPGTFQNGRAGGRLTRPYVYVGPGDPERREYDEGGNVWRATIEQGPPPAVVGEPQLNLANELGQAACLFVAEAVGTTGGVTFPQLVWLANLSLDRLGEYARDVYAGIYSIGHGALIPFDNARAVFGEQLHDDLEEINA